MDSARGRGEAAERDAIAPHIRAPLHLWPLPYRHLLRCRCQIHNRVQRGGRRSSHGPARRNSWRDSCSSCDHEWSCHRSLAAGASASPRPAPQATNFVAEVVQTALHRCGAAGGCAFGARKPAQGGLFRDAHQPSAASRAEQQQQQQCSWSQQYQQTSRRGALRERSGRLAQVAT